MKRNAEQDQVQQKHPLCRGSSIEWIQPEKGLLIGKYRAQDLGEITKVAAFDFDRTVVEPKSSNRVHAKDESDWKWMFPQIPQKIKQLSADGYTIVLFTNQRGLLEKEKREKSFKGRIRAVCAHLDLPMLIYTAVEDDMFRKPRPGLWETFIKEHSSVDLAESFYVGDAAGRQDNWKPKAKKDFADTDRKFAENIGLPFHTPEEFFLGEEKADFEYEFDYRSVRKDLPLFRPANSPLARPEESTEVILLVGFPASGKSSFVKKHLPSHYVHINQDTLKTKDKCLGACQEALALGKSCAIDNTNPDSATRAAYISLARSANVPIRCFEFTADMDLCVHNDLFRAVSQKRFKLPSIAFNAFKSRYVKPSIEEGFEEVKEINFVPEFSDDEMSRLWHMHHH